MISGPFGLIVGVVLTSVIAFLTVRYGKEKAQRFAENWVAPAWVVKRVLTQAKIDKTHKDFQLQLENKLQEETATLQDEFETMIRKITELQIESLSEIAQL